MRTSFSITFANGGQLQMRIAGKLTGYAAREGLAFLKTAVKQGGKDILLDLREITSLDSLGLGIFDWIRSQNGNMNVDILPPVLGINEEELTFIAQTASRGKTPDSHNGIANRRKRT
jgi:ABC-type transporter Mla MlaB component